MEIGERLKILLKNKGMSQKDLALALNHDATQLSRIISGARTPSWELLGQMVEFFDDVDLNWLFRSTYGTNDLVLTVNEEEAKIPSDILEDIKRIERILEEMKSKVSQ